MKHISKTRFLKNLCSGRISIFADFSPMGYKLSCCGSLCSGQGLLILICYTKRTGMELKVGKNGFLSQLAAN